MVRFIHGHRDLGHRVMGAVPRPGESVCLDGETIMVAWSVAWDLHGGEQSACVALKTEREYNRAVYGRDDPRGRKMAPAGQ
jgi:hypothetical protein